MKPVELKAREAIETLIGDFEGMMDSVDVWVEEIDGLDWDGADILTERGSLLMLKTTLEDRHKQFSVLLSQIEDEHEEE